MKTIQVGAFEAKNKLASLLAQAERGQRIFITRRGRTVAMLSPAPADATSPDQAGPSAVLKGFRAIRASARKGPETLKALIEEGRR